MVIVLSIMVKLFQEIIIILIMIVLVKGLMNTKNIRHLTMIRK